MLLGQTEEGYCGRKKGDNIDKFLKQLQLFEVFKKSCKKHLHFYNVCYIIYLVVTENVTRIIEDARLAQLVEHLTLNQGVQGSNP